MEKIFEFIKNILADVFTFIQVQLGIIMPL